MQTATHHAPRALPVADLTARIAETVADMIEACISDEATNRYHADYYGDPVRRARYATDKQIAFLRRAGLWQAGWQGVVTVGRASGLIGLVIERDRAAKDEGRKQAAFDFDAGFDADFYARLNNGEPGYTDRDYDTDAHDTYGDERGDW